MEHIPLILIVEDDPDIANLMAYHLHRCGYRTVMTADGRAALHVAFEQHPDLVVLDLMLPVLHGIAICQILKLNESTCDIPILIETALADEEQFARSTRAGARGFLTKPFGMTEFIVNVQALLHAAQPEWCTAGECEA